VDNTWKDVCVKAIERQDWKTGCLLCKSQEGVRSEVSNAQQCTLLNHTACYSAVIKYSN